MKIPTPKKPESRRDWLFIGLGLFLLAVCLTSAYIVLTATLFRR
jgi:hypothetical protein